MKKIITICKVMALAVMLFSTGNVLANSADALLERAQALLAGGNADEAFLLLDSVETQLANNLNFSYLHGLAALSSDRPGVAVMSFQRAVRIQPDFVGARLELGRAYYASGETELAQREFEQLLLLNPPPTALRVIERYLVAGEQKQERYTATFSGALSAVAGYNSNANSGLSRETLFGITLDEQVQETSSSFSGGELQLNGTLPLSKRLQLAVGLSGQSNRFDEASEVNSDGYGGRLSLNYNGARYAVTGQLASDQRDLGAGIDYRNQSAGLSLLVQLSESWLLRTGYSYGRLRFSEALENRDVNQREVSLGLFRLFNRSWVNSIGLLAFTERDRRPGGSSVAGENWSRRLLGAKLVFDAELSPRWGLFASYANLRSDFDEPFALDTTNRRDDRLQVLSARLVRERLLCNQCSLNISLGYIDQQSDNPRFEFDGTSVGIGMERSF